MFKQQIKYKQWNKNFDNIKNKFNLYKTLFTINLLNEFLLSTYHMLCIDLSVEDIVINKKEMAPVLMELQVHWEKQTITT